MQLASDVAIKSVGENASPLPWLSTGASVIICFLLAKCSASVRNPPKYLTKLVAIIAVYISVKVVYLS
jgi:hypothetical protein